MAAALNTIAAEPIWIFMGSSPRWSRWREQLQDRFQSNLPGTTPGQGPGALIQGVTGRKHIPAAVLKKGT